LLGQLPPMPYWPADTVEQSMVRHHRNMAGGAPKDGYEARWIHRDGKPIDVMIFEAPLVDAKGKHVGWMGSIVDLTSRKQFEVRERLQLERMTQQARLTTLGEVASALAHQLNQPLTAVSLYTAGVIRSLQRAHYKDKPVLDAMQRALEQVEVAGLIVQRIRDFLTRHVPRPEPCRMETVIEKSLALLHRDLTNRGIQPRLSFSPDCAAVMADPVLLEQVVINLVRNAMDALQGHPAPCIALCVKNGDARFVSVDVEDNGPGVGGLTINDLAAPFHSTKADGMGMGLSICRSIIEAHHGALQAGQSTLGGAWFSFSLPAVQHEQ